MDLKILLDNIERCLRDQKVSAYYVSKRAKRPDAIRNLRRRVRGEFDGSITIDTLIDIAKELGVEPWELMRPPGAIPQNQDFRDYVRDVIAEQLASPPAGKKKTR
jgi:hypothetical protein